MSADIIQQITAAIQFEPHADRDGGCPILIPVVTIAALLARGVTTHTFTIDLAERRDRGAWVTLAEAARMHEDDVDGMTYDQARVRIRRACDAGVITSIGEGIRRRIDPISLDAWRLRARELNLDRDNDV